MTIDRFILIVLLIAVTVLVYTIINIRKTIDRLLNVNDMQNQLIGDNLRHISNLQENAIHTGETLIRVLKILTGEETDGNE